MNKDIKRRWIDALRSGDYYQTGGALKDATGYCCLGVLCDLARKEGIVEWQISAFDNFSYRCLVINNGPDKNGLPYVEKLASTLPLAVRDWAGMTEGELSSPVGPRQSGILPTLVFMNDAECSNFSDIADVIERLL